MKDKLLKFKDSVVRLYSSIGLWFLKFLQKYYLYIAMFLVTVIALVARYAVVLHPTGDSVNYVLNWLNQIRDKGFSSFYQIEADYSPLYLFMLAIISLFPGGEYIKVNNYSFFKNDLIYVKSVYFVFTIALAFGVFLLVKALTSSKAKASFSYMITLILPTVFLNSAIWGNSDVIYATFLIYSFYMIITKRDGWAYLFFGLAFANKLQAVFILPFIAYLLFNRKMKLYKCIIAPLILLITFIPAYICGASFAEPFKYISSQVGGYQKLTLGCANMWQLIDVRGDVLKGGATWISLAIIFVILVLLHYRGIDLNKKENLFKVGFFLIMITIFFLPHMHERYFYVIDVLVLVYALIDKKKFYFVPLMQISSIIAYFHYLAGYYFIDSWGEGSVHIAAFINIAILLITIYDLMRMDHDSGFIHRNKNIEEEIANLKKDD